MIEFIDSVGLDDDDKMLILFRFATEGYLKHESSQNSAPVGRKELIRKKLPLRSRKGKAASPVVSTNPQASPIDIADRLISSFLYHAIL